MCIFADLYIVPEWSDLESFKKQTKTVDSKHDIRFKNLFKAIGRNAEITMLRNVLNYLKEKYKAEIIGMDETAHELYRPGEKGFAAAKQG